MLRGPRAHSVSWMLYGDQLEARLTCHAALGADCRLECSAGCTEFDLADHEHPLVDGGRCIVVEQLDVEGVADAHRGTHPPTDGYVEILYDGAAYTWTYSEPAPALRAIAACKDALTRTARREVLHELSLRGDDVAVRLWEEIALLGTADDGEDTEPARPRRWEFPIR